MDFFFHNIIISSIKAVSSNGIHCVYFFNPFLSHLFYVHHDDNRFHANIRLRNDPSTSRRFIYTHAYRG